MATMSSSSKLPDLPMVEQVSGSVVRFLGGNGGKFTLQGTNTYLVGTNPNSLILIDTAQGFPPWKKEMSTYLTEKNLSIRTCLLTHWHNDHVRGVPDLLDIQPNTSIYKNQTNQLDPDRALTQYTIHDIQNGQRFSDNQGFELEALHCPGHTKDHMAFIITKSNHPDEVGRIFTGDNVLGHGTAVFEDLATYLTSLHAMKARIEVVTSTRNTNTSAMLAYPGHGAVVVNATAKIDEYIKHRKTREDEALNVLRHGSVTADAKVNVRDWTSMEIVRVIYKDVPENLHVPAQMGLLMVLRKLAGEGKVAKTADDQWRVVEKSIL